jgi:Fe-S cluster biogenesis protein NfuA
MLDSQEFRDQIARIEGLIGSLESAANPALRATARNLVQSVMDLHAGAIDRILEILSKAGEPGAALLRALGADELVSSVLVLYDLHPDDFETRVHRGIEKARQVLARRGADVQVRAVESLTVRLKIDSGGHSCGSTMHDLETLVREALLATAPDAMEVIIETPSDRPVSGFVPIATLQTANRQPRPANVAP